MSTPDPDKTLRVDSDAAFTPRPSRGDAQFAPGSVIAGRYRIASILGKGGMGEVYRADDIKLGETVALKFLPARLARDPILLARLHDEVRLGRQVTHPNVCRIHDIAEWNGAHFVAMELVDGEDLARLLKRIGRLAHDKAVDIARGVAAGLLAAHAKGILHRDLKPANVMIDSHGDARITDFGLALSAGEEQEEIAGTPAYMAPELLEGLPATVQSDLYALGLVMYELFTGRRAHSAKTFPDRLREISSEIRTPSSLIRDLDPAVERVILRCLANDPAQRPRSAREIIESLPGGDPLAAAMAAGETPSPRIIAAAGTEGTLKPAIAWALLATVVAMIAASCVFASRMTVLRLARPKPPEVLTERIEEIRLGLGLPSQPFRVSSWDTNYRYIAWVTASDTSPQRWRRVERGLPVLAFWIRADHEPAIRAADPPRPTMTDPPQVTPGESAIAVDAKGRLVSLTAVPDPSWKARQPDWHKLFAAAGLELSRFTPAPPRSLPPAFADSRAGWAGKHPDDATPIRVEAAAWRGVPVFFRIYAPWDDAPDRTEELSFGRSFEAAVAVLLCTVIVVGFVLAIRNLRLRRGDRQGAIRVGMAMFLFHLIASLGFSPHALSISHELGVLLRATAFSLLVSCGYALIYIALEPYLRRRWPDRLIAWARLLEGKWRDPMVGRDVLIGIAGGLAHTSIALATGRYVMNSLHDPNMDLFSAPLAPLAWTANAGLSGMVFGLSLMIALVFMTIVFRRRGLAIAAVFALDFTMMSFASRDPRMLPFLVMIAALTTLMVARFGLLTITSFHATFALLFFTVIPDSIDWYTAPALVPTAVVLLAAIWAFRTSLGAQSPWHPSLLEE